MPRHTVSLALVWTSVTASAATGPPEISGTSLVAENATLVYGTRFDDPDLAVHVHEPPRRKKGDKAWGEPELRASLERVLAGRARPAPEPPEKDRRWRKVGHKEANTLLCNTGGHASSYPSVVKVLHVRNSHGVTPPYVLNVPEIWGVSPGQLVQGDSATVWGANLGSQFALVSPGGQVAAICKAYSPYCTHSHRPEGKFLKLLAVPSTLSPGDYSLYAYGGHDDLGWGEPFAVEAVERPAPPEVTVDARKLGAVGNGVTDDTEAIERAIAAAAKAGGGRVLLPTGRFVVSRALSLPPGVHLVGHSPQATIIEASRWKTFEGTIPEKCFSRPAGYDAETYKPKGWAIDWPMGGMYKDAAYLLWLQSDTAIENLTVDATPSLALRVVVLVADEKGGVCRRATVRNCHILCERTGLYAPWPDFRVAEGILLTSSTEDLVVERTRLSVNGVCLNHLPGCTRRARIRYNTFTTADPHAAFELWMPRTTQQCLIEGNLFENGGRAKTEQGHGFPYPITRNCYLHNIFRNCNKGDGELLMYETGGLRWFGRAAGGDATHIQAAPTERTEWEADHFKGFTVVITQGKGVGQFRRVIANATDTVAVDKPWRVAPDGTTTFGLMWGGVVENVHVGNEFFYCHYYCGIYGSGLRNVWVNEVYESVGGGTFLWPIAGPRVMALNLIYGSKYHERAGIVVTNDRRPRGKPAEAELKAYQRLQKCFGNEIRGCCVRERSYVSTENGQMWTRPLRYHWARHNRSCPITPLPGTEAAITVWDNLQWSGYPEHPGLDELPASTCWNLLAENMIVRCPVGIQIGKAVEKTILASNSFHECGQPLKDLGRDTVDIDSFIHAPSRQRQ